MSLWSGPKSRKTQAELSAEMACDGGLNVCDPDYSINDNQSADTLNMWYYENRLQFRPGLKTAALQQYGKIIAVYPENGEKLLLKRICKNGAVTDEKYGIYIITESAVLTFDGTSFFRVPNGITFSGGSASYTYNDYSFSGCVLLPAGDADYAVQHETAGSITAAGNIIYMFGSGYFFAIGPYIITDGSGNAAAEILINYKPPYVPTLYKNTPPAGGGDAYEARNFLTGSARQLFTTDASSTLYRLFDSSLDDDVVTISYDGISGGKSSFVFYQGQTSAAAGGITATLDRSAGTIAFSSPLADAPGAKLKNNLCVEYEKTVYASPPVCGCTIGKWFGDTQGKNGGNRIFLSGSVKNPNTVYYCAPNNPAYFPDDGFVTAGDPSEPITAFGRQYDILAVFKKGSIYALDFETSGPGVKLVNGFCGCDMGQSLRLIGNRLAWCDSSGRIYTLLSTQIKDEKTVAEISGNIGGLARKAMQNGAACSADDGAHYFLFAGNEAFVWDYSRTPYSGGQDAQKARKGLSIYRWELPHSVSGAFVTGGTVYVYDGSGNIYSFDNSAASDDGLWFDAWWYSKAQDFGLTGRLKIPCRSFMTFLNSGEAKIFICLGSGEYKKLVRFDNTGCGQPVNVDFSPRHTPSISFTAGIRRVPGDFSRPGLTCICLKARSGAAV